MSYQLPVYIRRFKPVEILQFDPDPTIPRVINEWDGKIESAI